MRIGLVSYEFPPQRGLGGVGTYMFRLAGALGRAGHEVVVLSGPSDECEIPLSNVTVHRINPRHEPLVHIRGLRFLYWNVVARFVNRVHPLVWQWLHWDMASTAALLRIHQQTPLDVIEAPEHAANGLCCARLRRWPTIIRVHGPWDLFFGINRAGGSGMNRLLAFLERKSTEAATLVTAPSRTMASFIASRWNMPGLPTVVPNFMDVPAEPAPLPDAAGPQRIVCAGRLERFKGQDILVSAFARIAQVHPPAELHLIGPDQWSTTFKFSKLVARLVPDERIRRRIFLDGPQPLAQVQKDLTRATIAVVCSCGFESFSLSTLEAMAAARPIVGSRVGAIPELLDDGRCGLLAAPGSVRQLAEAIDRLLSDRAMAQSMGLAAHARALRCYDSQTVIPAFVETYEHARKLWRQASGGNVQS